MFQLAAHRGFGEQMLGASGVPFALVNGKYRVSGAQRAEVWAATLREVVRLKIQLREHRVPGLRDIRRHCFARSSVLLGIGEPEEVCCGSERNARERDKYPREPTIMSATPNVVEIQSNPSAASARTR